MLDEIHFTRSPIIFECPIPVTEEGESMRDGEPIPIEERTAKCGGRAPYLIGAQVTCEEHLRVACGLMGIDADDVVRELEEGFDA